MDDEDDFYAAVARRIREVRAHQGLTQQDVANATGLSRGSIANIEGARQAPSLFTLARLGALLNVGVADLIEGGFDLAELPKVDPVGRRWGELVSATIKVTEAMVRFEQALDAYGEVRRG